MNKIKSIASAVYSYTHIFVGAGAVVTSFLDHQALPPKFAAGVVIASQALRVLSDWVTVAHAAAPTALKLAEDAVGQVKAAVTPVPVLPPAAPLEPAAPQPVQVQAPSITTVASGVVSPQPPVA